MEKGEAYMNKFGRKILSVALSGLMMTNSLSNFVIVAEDGIPEENPEETAVGEETPEPAPEVTPEAPKEEIKEPESEKTPEPEKTPETAPEPEKTPEAVPEPEKTPEAEPEKEPEPEQKPAEETKEPEQTQETPEPEITPEAVPEPEKTPETAPEPEKTPEAEPVPTETAAPEPEKEPVYYTLTFIAAENGGIIISAARPADGSNAKIRDSQKIEDTAKLTNVWAWPNPGYEFDHWELDNQVFETREAAKIQAEDLKILNNSSFKAVFRQKAPVKEEEPEPSPTPEKSPEAVPEATAEPVPASTDTPAPEATVIPEQEPAEEPAPEVTESPIPEETAEPVLEALEESVKEIEEGLLTILNIGDPAKEGEPEPGGATEDPEQSADPEITETPEAGEETEQPAEEPEEAGEEAEEPEPETWTVTFYNRDAQVHQTVAVEKGQQIGDQLPAVIARDEYNAYWAVGEIVQGGQGMETRVTGARISSEWVPEGDVSIVPDYSLITYTVTFYSDEQKTDVVETKTVDATTNYCLNEIPSVPRKPGHAGKWMYSQGEFNNSVAVHENTDVWPVYDQSVFTVTYMVGENTYETDTYYAGDTLTLPADPVSEGKEFIGWFAGDTQYNGGEAVNANLTLTAQFNDAFKVDFIVEHEGGTEESAAHYYRTAGETVGQLPQNPFVSGKEFIKWVNRETNEEVTADTVVTGNITAVAQFRDISVYTITAEYYYESSVTPGKEVVFNTDLIQVEEELPYTITAPSTTQTDEQEVPNGPVYYPENPTAEITRNNFEDGNTYTIRFKYIPYTALYDIVYKLKDLNGDGYLVIPFKEDKDNPNSIMEIGYITKKNSSLSKMGEEYIEELKKYLSGVSGEEL